jgi:hypothetical protein
MFEAFSIKAQNEDRLSKCSGVVGVAVGHKWVNGVPVENQHAVIVFVEKKRTRRGVTQKFSAGDIIPDQIDGVPTDVIEVGKIKKQAGFMDRVRPIKPGFSCGHHDITAGTIGGFFMDRDNEPVILSNNHVLANENRGQAGDAIYQPGPYDAKGDLTFRDWPDPVSALPYIATLKRFVTLKNDGNVQDSAIAVLHPKVVGSGLIDSLYPTVNQACSGFGTAEVGMQVQKCGRTTGYTTGRVIALNGTFTIEYDFGGAKFNDCVVMTPLSKGGDSGSLIMDMGMKGVAHLFAGSNKVTLGNPINYAVNEYGLTPWNVGGAATPTPTGGKDWRPHTAGGSIKDEGGAMVIESPANQFCYLEDYLGNFNAVSVVVNTGSDKGATWGPGLTVQWPTGTMKVNVRYNDKFGGYFNGTYNINIGAVKPDTDYVLRIRKTTADTYVGEVFDGGRWYTVIELPRSIFPHPPVAVRVGKTDLTGQASNHTDAGPVGKCTVRRFEKN